jgi:uncharacterized protein YndB with AHSA1/START domain
MWFKVRPSDISFADQSKKHFTYDFVVQAPPAEVFRLVTSPEALSLWLPDFRSARWVTSPPPGVGSLREVRLKTISVHEKVLVWEPASRFLFTIVKASAPILGRMVEDYRFDATPEGTRVRWTIAYQPSLLAAPLELILAPRFAHMFESAAKRLCEVAPSQLSGPRVAHG